MASKVEWALSLLDKTSEPASKVGKSLRLIEDRLNALDKAAREVTDPKIKDKFAFARVGLEAQRAQYQMKLAGENTGSWIVKLHSALAVLKMVGGAIKSAAGGVLNIVIGFAKAGIEAASFKESSRSALAVILGSKPEASGAIDEGMGFAAKAPFEMSSVLGWQKGLLSGGFKRDETMVIMKALGDLASVNGFDEQVGNRASLALRKIKSRGKFQGDESLMQLAEAGVSADAVFANLAKMLGKSLGEVRKLQAGGKINSQQGIYAIVEAMRDSVSGGKLGSAMDSLSMETTDGIGKRLKASFRSMLMDLDSTAGFGAFKGALRNAMTAISDSSSKISQRVRDVFDRIMTAVFGRFAGADGLERMETAIDSALQTIDSLVNAGRRVWAFFEGVGTGLVENFAPLRGLFDGGPLSAERLAIIAEKGAKVGEVLGKLIDAVYTLMHGLGAFGKPEFNGSRTGDAMGKKWGRVSNGSFWERAYDASPLGALDLTGSVIGDLIGKDYEGPPRPSGAFHPTRDLPLGGTNVNAPVNVSIDARGATPDAVQAIADATERAVAEGLASGLMSVAMSTGAQP